MQIYVCTCSGRFITRFYSFVFMYRMRKFLKNIYNTKCNTSLKSNSMCSKSIHSITWHGFSLAFDLTAQSNQNRINSHALKIEVKCSQRCEKTMNTHIPEIWSDIFCEAHFIGVYEFKNWFLIIIKCASFDWESLKMQEEPKKTHHIHNHTVNMCKNSQNPTKTNLYEL